MSFQKFKITLCLNWLFIINCTISCERDKDYYQRTFLYDQNLLVMEISTISVRMCRLEFVNKDNAFGGGSGAGVTITPVAFLVIKGEAVRLLPVAEPASNSVGRLIEMLPDLIDQISALAKKKEVQTAE